MTHKGSCHCGQIKFEAQGTFDTAMECNCSHCSRKGYLLWFVPRSQFELQSPESALSTYTFNKHVIQHQFCGKCGCAPFGFGKDPKGNDIAAINVRCVPELDRSNIQVVQFDGRSL